ncbi:class I SAM-dependent methyltransferase [Candidatus Latescibacterota bacterium]
MKEDASYIWFRSDSSSLDKYLASADVVIVERHRMLKILIDIFSYHFEGQQNLNMLDLGCGDGIVTKYIREKYPHNAFSLMDGSIHMIEKARQNQTGDNISFIHKTFANYIASPVNKQVYDFVYSAWAIHHLDIDGKKKLYAKVFGEMRSGGLFIVMDTVQPSTERSEQWQFRMWIDWMNETLHTSGFENEVGKYDNIPNIYKNQDEDQPSPLFQQMDILTEVGFMDVDCFFKHGVFTLFGGTKLGCW